LPSNSIGKPEQSKIINNFLNSKNKIFQTNMAKKSKKAQPASSLQQQNPTPVTINKVANNTPSLVHCESVAHSILTEPTKATIDEVGVQAVMASSTSTVLECSTQFESTVPTTTSTTPDIQSNCESTSANSSVPADSHPTTDTDRLLQTLNVALSNVQSGLKNLQNVATKAASSSSNYSQFVAPRTLNLPIKISEELLKIASSDKATVEQMKQEKEQLVCENLRLQQVEKSMTKVEEQLQMLSKQVSEVELKLQEQKHLNDELVTAKQDLQTLHAEQIAKLQAEQNSKISQYEKSEQQLQDRIKELTAEVKQTKEESEKLKREAEEEEEAKIEPPIDAVTESIQQATSESQENTSESKGSTSRFGSLKMELLITFIVGLISMIVLFFI